MLLRILKNSFLRRPKSVFLVVLSITMGSVVATAFLGITAEVSHKMALELRSYGANILLEPQASDGQGDLREEDLPKIKTVFWKYNILGFTPYLFGLAEISAETRKEHGVIAGTWFSQEVAVAGEETTTHGVRHMAPWWDVTGRWPETEEEAIIGSSLARRLGVGPGSRVSARFRDVYRQFRVVGVVTTGGYEDEQLCAPLAAVQGLLGMKGKLSRVLVSALTVPMDDFGKRNPVGMSKQEYERWYCTAYVTSIARNVEEVMTGSRAKPVWQVAGAEGGLLGKLDKIMLLLTVFALVASAIAVSTTLTASIAERTPEIALLKTLGADRVQITSIVLGEVLLLSLMGGITGYLIGNEVAGIISRTVFNSTISPSFWLFPTALLSASVVAMAGSAAPLRKALLIKPVLVLKG